MAFSRAGRRPAPARSIIITIGAAALALIVAMGSGPNPVDAATGGGAPASRASEKGGPGQLYLPHVPGEVLIKFRKGAGPNERASLRAQLNASKRHTFHSGAEHWKLGAGLTTEEAIGRLRNNPHVEYVEPNYIVTTALAPNDPFYSQLYGFHNTGQTGGKPGADIHAEQAWDLTTGSRGVLVAVIDTGIDLTHPDLQANIWTNPGEIPGNGIDDDGNGFVDDVHGWDFVNNDNDPSDDNSHGTHVSGTIGAVGNNGEGVVGVNWKVSIVPLKFLSASGSGATSDAVQAVEYATALGVRVMSNSWGGGAFSNTLLDAIKAAAAANILFVAAAGNSGLNNDLGGFYPANYDSPNVISVAATDQNDDRASFSDYGPTTVDIAAPGVNILSTVPGGYGIKSGTSMATPVVSGAAALLVSVAPSIDVVAMKDLLISSVDPVASLNGLIVSGGRLNAYKPLISQDSVPPGPITDLAAANPTSSSAILTWTATGDDGAAGRAASYDVRYATSPIDAAGFDAAARAAGAPVPGPSGASETMEVQDLLAGTTYYFAVEAVDDFGNRGPVSNGASATTLPPPTFSSSPPSFSAALLAGQSTTRALTIRNVGVGTLDWRIPPPDLDLPAPAAGGGVSIAGAGGPDLFGYRFVDSDEPGGPPFDWTDLSRSGTPIEGLTGDEQLSSPIALGFPFSFYGNSFDSVRVSTNGYLSFTSTLATALNQPLPSPNAPENLVAPFWCDLDFKGARRAVYASDGSTFTVQFTDVPRFSGQGSYTFQVSLSDTGEVAFRYLSISGPISPVTSGLQDATRTDGLQVVFNQNTIHGGLRVRIVPLAQWLTASPARGRLAAGESQEVTLTLDAARLPVGTYQGRVVVLNNDPIDPVVDHPVELDVSGAAAIDVTPRSLDFGTVFAGFAASRPLKVTNTGTDDLVVTSISAGDPAVTFDPSAFTLPPAGAITLTATYAPAAPGVLSSSVTFATNASNAPGPPVTLAGIAAPPPSLEVAPAALGATLDSGESASATLRITNDGAADLDVDLSPEESTAGLLSVPPAPVVANGGFEIGSFSGWTATNNGRGELQPWAVERAGAGFFQSSLPLEGTFDALNGFDGDAGLVYRLYQDITIPQGTLKAELSYYDRIQFDSLGISSTLPRIYEATIEDPNGGVLALIAHVEVTVGGKSYTDLGWRKRTADLAPYAGRTVRLMIRETIPEAFAGPAEIEFDAFRINSTLLPAWLGVQPSHVTIPAGSSTDVSVNFDAGGSGSAVYQGDVRIDAGGLPATARVPATLTVVAAPRMVVTKEIVTPVSVSPYSTSGASTSHDFAVPSPPVGGGSVELTVTGDYGQPTEKATMDVEGTAVGTLGNSGLDCSPTSLTFPIDAAPLAAAAADGVVTIHVGNTSDVGVACAVNTHGVRLTYRTLADRLDFGSFFVGLSRSAEITVENAGTAVLDVTSIAADLPVFTTSASTLRLAPGTARSVTVTFTPGAPGDFNGTLTIVGSDRHAPVVTLPISGTGLPTPVAGVSPPALSATLIEGMTERGTLTLTNSGGSPLSFNLHAIARSAGTSAPGALGQLSAGTALVTEFSAGDLLEVDTTTGSRSLVVTGLNGPNKGLVASPAGNAVYLTESLNGEIVAVDLTTHAVQVLAAGLNFPNGLAASPDGTTLYVTETGSGRLLKLSLLNGSLLAVAGGLNGPNGVAVNAAGDTAYVADLGDGSLIKVDIATGKLSSVASGLGGPVAVVLDGTGLVAYVAESASGSIDRVEIASGTVSTIVGGLDHPGSLTLGGDGTVAFVTEFGAGTLDAVDISTGTVAHVATGLGGPVGVAFATLPGFLTLTPPGGSVPAFGSLDVAVDFDSAGLFSGTYVNEIDVTTDDPAHPLLVVPATLTVVGIPRIKVTGPMISLESSRNFFTIGALSIHRLPITVPPEGDGSVELIANGDYGAPSETATLAVEGRILGSVGGIGTDCATASGIFQVDAPVLAAAAQDGVLEITVQNSIDVQANCPQNEHRVRLEYRGSSDHLDFGSLFVGRRSTLSLLVEDTGSALLDVTSITSDSPAFITPVSSVRLAARSFYALAVDFAPPGLGPFTGTLTIASTDANTPSIAVKLTGTGVAPPVVSVHPASLSTTLVEGNHDLQTLNLVNDGASALDFSLVVRSHFPGALSVPFAGLSVGASRASGNPAPRSVDRSPEGIGGGPVFQGVPGDYEALDESPTILTCVVADPSSGILYAQADQGNAFFRYIAATGIWQQLTPAPIVATNDGGAALLNGRIYTAYAADGAFLGIYDIASNTWTAVPGPIGAGSGDIASDGVRFLYLVAGATFIRYDPDSATSTTLSPPPFPFEAWGGLKFLDGVLYGHQGNGLTGFAMYDISSDRWTLLPPLPDGATLGSAIDPGSREYFAYGSYGGSNLYRYAIDAGTWKVSTIPFFTVDDGGLAWLPGPIPAIYFVQGEAGTQFARLITARSFVSVTPSTGSVPPMSSVPIGVLLESTGLVTGAYDAGIEVASNDPVNPNLEVPVRLNVVGVPHIRVSGEPVVLTSRVDYFTSGARTTHRFPVAVPPSGGGRVDVVADGDYSDLTENADVLLEGSTLGFVGGAGKDCIPVTGTFPIGAGGLSSAAADGVIEIALQNTSSVGPICGVNRHTVTLTYSGRADRLDYGDLFVGGSRSLTILVDNVGTEVLVVSSITSDRSEYAPSVASTSISPGGTLPVVVTFTPLAAGHVSSTLRLASNDPDAPSITVALEGGGLTPPVIDVQPRSLAATLLEDDQAILPLTISNGGGSPLDYSVRVRFENATQGLPGDLESLPPSPAAMTCVVADPAAGILYGQDLLGTRFFRYLASTDTWERIADAPFQSPNGCGATILGGRIYTVSTEDGSLLGIYDIDRNAWSEVFLGLGAGTGDIAGDGARFLYFAAGSQFLRYDTGTGATTPLTSPPFPFDPLGGLQYLDGAVYGHRGGGRTEFARYDVAGGGWLSLPPIPGGAVLGSTVDPIAREYFAYGPHGGTSLYRYSIDANAWSVTPIPFFTVDDGGLAWLPGRSPGVYFVEGAGGFGFARLINEPGFTRPDLLSGSVPAFSSTTLHVTFDSAGLGLGLYQTSLEITSNDPNAPLVAVPASLRVVRIPVLAIGGEPVDIESRRDYTSIGARTLHRFGTTVPPGGGGSIQLTVTGDFSSASKTATLDVEGRNGAVLSGTSFGCGSATLTVPIDEADLRALVADGAVDATVQNSPDVTTTCPINNHTLRLTYSGSASLLDYGDVFVGTHPRRAIVIGNRGTDTLVVSTIASDAPSFTPAVAAVVVPPHGSFLLQVTFAPAAPGDFTGHLRLLSNDPAAPSMSIDLAGHAAAPPVAALKPASISAALPPGGAAVATRTIRITNTGGSDLGWSAALLPLLGSASSASGPASAALGAGGPDAFGYLYRDSDHLGGPAFSWTDVQSIGTPVPVSGNNATSAAIPIGFTFPFYGNAFTSVRVCTNGWLSFTSGRATFQNPDTLPGGGFQAPENLLAPFWDDLDFGSAQRATSWSDGTRFIVQYTGVPRVGGGPGSTFQVILYPSGRIVFQYLTMAGTLDSATIGMQNADRTIGLRVSFDEPYVHDGLALAFDRAPAWAAASPLSGTIPPGGAADVAIALSSSGLAAGGYGAVVVFATGDPFHASILSPIALHVGEIALDFVGLDPPVLNLKSSGSTVRASLQLPPAYDPHLIDVSTVSINGTLFANPSPIEFTDVNGDGIPELSLKFDRAALAAILGPGTTVPITFTGEVKDVVWFRGTALLKVTRK